MNAHSIVCTLAICFVVAGCSSRPLSEVTLPPDRSFATATGGSLDLCWPENVQGIAEVYVNGEKFAGLRPGGWISIPLNRNDQYELIASGYNYSSQEVIFTGFRKEPASEYLIMSLANKTMDGFADVFLPGLGKEIYAAATATGQRYRVDPLDINNYKIECGL